MPTGGAVLNLQDLRVEALDWLDDPAGDVWSPGGNSRRIDQLINTAYMILVREIDDTGVPWNLSSFGPIEVSVTNANREYKLADSVNAVAIAKLVGSNSGNIRKPVEVLRDVDGNSYPLDIIAYARRNQYAVSSKYPQQGSSRSYSNRVYFYRRSDAAWYLGFADDRPETQTLQVYYLPTILRLTIATDVPLQVPDQHHYLIPILAAVMGKGGQTNRDAKDLWQMYTMGLLALRTDASTVTSTIKSSSL